MAHAFSLQSIKKMEHHIDQHLLQFRKNLDHYADTGALFDLKELIAFFVLDILGDLAVEITHRVLPAEIKQPRQTEIDPADDAHAGGK